MRLKIRPLSQKSSLSHVRGARPVGDEAPEEAPEPPFSPQPRRPDHGNAVPETREGLLPSLPSALPLGSGTDQRQSEVYSQISVILGFKHNETKMQ